MNTHCRIGRVKFKTGQEIRVIKRVERNKTAQTLIEHAARITELLGDKLSGYAIVAWDKEGCFSRGTRFDRKSFMGQTLLPEFVAAVLRRDVSADVTIDVLNGDH